MAMSRTRASEAGNGGKVSQWVGLGWLVFFCFYVWLVAKIQLQQLVAGALTGLGVAGALFALCRRSGLQFEVKAGWLGIFLWRLPAKMLRDLGLLAFEFWRALVHRRRPRGTYREIPFAPGKGDPLSSTRRSLVVVGISIPPNSIALSIDSKKGTVLVHQLISVSQTPVDREWPV